MGDKPTDIGYGRGEEMKNVLDTFNVRLFRGMLFRDGVNRVSRDHKGSPNPQGYVHRQVSSRLEVEENGASITLICDRSCSREETFKPYAGDYYNKHIVVLDANEEGIVYSVDNDTGQVVCRTCTGLRPNASDSNTSEIMFSGQERVVVDPEEIDGLAEFVELYKKGKICSREALWVSDGFRKLFNEVCSDKTLQSRRNIEELDDGRLRASVTLPPREGNDRYVGFTLETSGELGKGKRRVVVRQNDGSFVEYSLEDSEDKLDEGRAVECFSFEMKIGEDGCKRRVNRSNRRAVGADEINRLTKYIHNRLGAKNSPSS